jgi:hypothetical protein
MNEIQNIVSREVEVDWPRTKQILDKYKVGDEIKYINIRGQNTKEGGESMSLNGN